MNVRYLFLSLLFLISNTLISEVIVEEVNIKSEFYGPFSKNRAEFIFHNIEDISDESGYCSFKLDSSAFVTDLWLEIDGELVRAETYSDYIGSKIYHEIKRKKKDPALLVKYQEDDYYLSVFPVNDFERRKVIVEYYSVLETKDGKPSWNFDISKYYDRRFNNPVKINCEAICNLPNGSAIYSNDKNYNIVNSQPVKISGNDNLNLRFSLPNGEKLSRYFDYQNEITETVANNNQNRIKQIIYIQDFIENFIVDNNSSQYYIYDSVIKDDEFLNKFITYIQNSNPNHKIYHQIFSNWFRHKENIIYNDGTINFKNYFTDNIDYISAPCPFLQTYFDHLMIINQDISSQTKSKFLTMCTSKLVLENNEITNRLKKQIMRSGINRRIGVTCKFTVYEEAPIAIYNEAPKVDDSILQLLKVSGDIYVEAEVLENGDVGKVSIKKSLLPFLDRIAVETVKKWKYEPAKSNNKPLAVWVTFPIKFKFDKDKRISKSDYYELYNKKYLLSESLLKDEHFIYEKSRQIKLFSDDFFALLMQNPQLVKITYLFYVDKNLEKLGVIDDDGHSVYIYKC